MHCDRTLLVNIEGGQCPLLSVSIYDPPLMKVASWDSTRDTIGNTYIYVYMYMHIYVCILCIYIYAHIYTYIYTHKFITSCRTVLPLCMAIFSAIFGEICMVLHNNT